MDRSHQIKQALAALSPTHLDVVDESYKHSVPDGAQSHWNVMVVSPAFADCSRVARHRLVYKALGPLMQQIHALALDARTPDEWDGGGVTATPECLGGSKHESG